MKKRAVHQDQSVKKLEDAMIARFRAVFDSFDRLREQLERSTRDIQKSHAADLRVTRLVLREHNLRIKGLERRASK